MADTVQTIKQSGEQPTQTPIVPQTKLAIVGYLLLAIAMVVGLIQQPRAAGGWAALALYIAMFVLSTYVVNCTVVGHCSTYAWVVGYIVVMVGIVSVMGVVMTLLKA